MRELKILCFQNVFVWLAATPPNMEKLEPRTKMTQYFM